MMMTRFVHLQELYVVQCRASTVCHYVVRLSGLFGGVEMGVVEGWGVVREGGEGGGGEKERSEGDSSTQPRLQPDKPSLIAPPTTWCM